MSFYNKEYYPDPTAYQALKNIDKPKKLVFICSPYQGDISTNIIRAERYGRFAVSKKVVPVIPHLMYPCFLDEYTPEERAIGLEMGLLLLDKCNEIWVFGDKISEGMKVEIEKAKEIKMPIKYFDISCNQLEGGKKIMEKCFADTGKKECSALKIKNCNGCGFYKTKKEAARGRRQSLLRILSLDKNVKGHILEKYYGDDTRVEG